MVTDEGDVTRLLQSDFLVTATDTEQKERIEAFTSRIGNDACQRKVCAVCARLQPISELREMNIQDIPNYRLLRPLTPHPSHTLFDGILLHENAVSKKTRCFSCRGCINALEKGTLPPLSLANGMYIGEVPFELARLSLAEKLLVAKAYPVAYVVKLFPKFAGATSWSGDKLHKGLRGNVSTHMLPVQGIADLVDDKKMPPQSKILSSVISVSFIGPTKLTANYIPPMFRVSRERVAAALRWLKTNNPIYRDITISEERLADLPENGVPDEILANIRHSTDVGTLYQEHDGYIPGVFPLNQRTDEEDFDLSESTPSSSSIIHDVLNSAQM